MKRESLFQTCHSARFYLCAVAALLVVLLAACGGDTNANSSPTSTSTATANTPQATTPTTITSAPPASTNSATSTPKPVQGSTQVVLIINDSNGAFAFSPASLTIMPGTTVIWKNMSSVPHTITSDDGKTFDSGTVAPGGTFKFKFTSPGSFLYHCNYHPYMKAMINL